MEIQINSENESINIEMMTKIMKTNTILKIVVRNEGV